MPTLAAQKVPLEIKGRLFRFSAWLISFQGFMIVIATAFIPISEQIISIPQLRRRGGVNWFCSVRLSVRNQYFPSHFSQQPCITATSNLVWQWNLHIAYRIHVCQLSASYFQAGFIFGLCILE